MKSLTKLALTAMTALTIFGCSGKDAGTTDPKTGDPKSAESTGKKLLIGISIPAADHGWTAGVKYWAEQEMKKHPEADFMLQTAKGPEEQIASIDAMLAKKIDGLVILATESAPLTPKASEVHEKGVFIVNVDRGFLKPVADIYIAGDNEEFGRKSAEFMAERMGKKGNLVILEGIPCTVNTERVDAAKKVFAKFPDIKILDSQSGMWNQTKAYEVMQGFLVKHKQIDAIWGGDDDMALGAEKALKQSGRDKNIWILGGAGMKDIVKRVMDKDPMYPADITYPPAMIATGIDTAVKALKARKPGDKFEPKKVVQKLDMILPDNAKDFYFPDSIY